MAVLYWLESLDRLQPVLHAAAGASNMFVASGPSLAEDHRTQQVPAGRVFHYLYNTAAEYLARDLHWATHNDSWQSLCLARTHRLVILRMKFSTVSVRACVFGVTSTHVWNALPASLNSSLFKLRSWETKTNTAECMKITERKQTVLYADFLVCRLTFFTLVDIIHTYWFYYLLYRVMEVFYICHIHLYQVPVHFTAASILYSIRSFYL